jgi:pSer/pThr/pTyr-binding forkhead associated (FHA) protein
LIGSHRYRFTQGGDSGAGDESEDEAVGTRGWQTVDLSKVGNERPSLVRLNPDGTETSFVLEGDPISVGQDSGKCQLVIKDDPAVSRVHAVIKKVGEDWQMEDAKSLNGTWLSVGQSRLGKSASFQLGEQRFRFRVIS